MSNTINVDYALIARQYDAAAGDVSAAARAAGVNRNTYAARVRIAKAKFPELFAIDWVRDGKPLTEEQCRYAVACWDEAKGSMKEASRLAQLTHSAISHRVDRARQLYPHLIKHEWPKDPGGPPRKTLPEAFTVDDHVSESRSAADARVAKTALKDALGRIRELQDKLRDFERAANASFKPAEWALPERAPEKREHMPYLLTSDFQAGEVIRADETETGYGYDSDTFRRRYRAMIAATIDLSFNNASADWTYPGIIYARGGDTISGGIHQELAETDDLTPIEAVELVFEEEAAGIAKLVDAFGRVDVKSPDAAGNHDRNTFKPQSKKTSAHSYDRLIAYMLRRQFKTDARVHFQTSPSYDVVFPIYDMSVLLTHGDRIGSRGGQGFIGPAATIMRGAQKVIQEQAALGRRIDRVDMGHFHTPICLDWVICNGCLPGYSEYAKSFRMRPTPPQQFLLYHHPKRRVVDIKPINLKDA